MTATSVAVAAAVVALAFCLGALERWLMGGRPHDGAWALAMGIFAAAAGVMAAGAAAGWNGPAFRVFYLLGAIVDVPWLAVGTVYLLVGARAGRASALVALGLSAFAAGVLASAPFTHPVPAAHLPQGSAVFGALPRALAGVCSGGGATVVLAGALWSGVRAYRRRPRAIRLVSANALVAGGTLALGSSGLLNSVAGQMTAFAAALLAGVVILFCGFLVATASSGATAGPAPPAEPAAEAAP